MSLRDPDSLPALDCDVTTACGGKVSYATNTPRAVYKEEWVFFCLPECRQLYEKDPAASCLADRILSDRK